MNEKNFNPSVGTSFNSRKRKTRKKSPSIGHFSLKNMVFMSCFGVKLNHRMKKNSEIMNINFWQNKKEEKIVNKQNSLTLH